MFLTISVQNQTTKPFATYVENVIVIYNHTPYFVNTLLFWIYFTKNQQILLQNH